MRRVIEYIRMLEGKAVEAVETFYSAIHLNCMETLHEISRKELLEILKEYPSRAMPVILSRMVRKAVEWTAAKAEMNELWKKVNADYFHLSLVHPGSSKLSKSEKSSSPGAGSGSCSEESERCRGNDPRGIFGRH